MSDAVLLKDPLYGVKMREERSSSLGNASSLELKIGSPVVSQPRNTSSSEAIPAAAYHLACEISGLD